MARTKHTLRKSKPQPAPEGVRPPRRYPKSAKSAGGKKMSAKEAAHKKAMREAAKKN